MVTKTGKKVQEFYNKTPFPDYDISNFETKEDLKIAAWPFAKILDRSIPAGCTVVDVGTGTGQLSAYLSLRRRYVLGIDFSDSSLKKATLLKDRLELNTLALSKVDILDLSQIENINKTFDYVLCLGVLHHTGDPYKAFINILELVKPGGYVAIGLYNRCGRILLKIRRILTKTIYKNNQAAKDKFVKMQIGEIEDTERARGWWNDQYLHPHETTHTLGEILRWFKKNNIDYYETLPSSKINNSSDVEIAGVWNKIGEKKPGPFVRFLKQVLWVFTTHKEGGYWITFGRKHE